ncbi:hypothetical protein PK34_05765 [Stutzerimonas stutzeri]|nr:MAG: hypothetical protein JL55_35955 [[Pseudomonas] sp. BICA1-14]KKJ97679.1 hypothetical protein PK34_05765 [Stutzerimonas stutzeri]
MQTLSRLNRTFGDSKPTFILDFFNDAQDILDAFLPYYTKAELTDVTDPQLIYDLQKKLDAEGIYHWEEVAAFALAFFDPNGTWQINAKSGRYSGDYPNRDDLLQNALYKFQQFFPAEAFIIQPAASTAVMPSTGAPEDEPGAASA